MLDARQLAAIEFEAERECLAFAEEFDTDNVALAIGHARAGHVSWVAVRDLFARSLVAGIEAVR